MNAYARMKTALGWDQMTPEQIRADIETAMRIFEIASSPRVWPRRVPEHLMRSTALTSQYPPRTASGGVI